MQKTLYNISRWGQVSPAHVCGLPWTKGQSDWNNKNITLPDYDFGVTGARRAASISTAWARHQIMLRVHG